MAKKQQSNPLSLIDLAAFLLAVWFVVTVINNSLDLIRSGLKDAPASWAVILAILLVAWSWYQRKYRLSIISVITLTVIITSGAIWLLGIHK